MQSKENYTPQLTAAFGLTLAILVSFQLYIRREPVRIARDEAIDRQQAVEAGDHLYAENCVMCHGSSGEGVDGPPLNDKTFLTENSDAVIFTLISSGVPSSEMPAWNQTYGGPYTDEQIRQITAFIRSWEPDAPDQRAIRMMGEPVKGLDIYETTCIVCHGESGSGTQHAPALNDPDRLAKFDDEWYMETIAKGRPNKRMPTWGTVLSPVDIRDIVALLRAWELGEDVEPISPGEALAETMHMMDHGDMHAAELALQKALRGATGEALEVLQEAMDALQAGQKARLDIALNRAAKILGMEIEGHEH